MSELQGLQLGLPELRGRRVSVVGVSVDPVETNARLAHDARLEFPLLADPDLRMIDAYGLRHAGAGPDGGDIAHSASVLIDAAGVVRWTVVTQNFRVRPTVPDVLAALATLPVSH